MTLKLHTKEVNLLSLIIEEESTGLNIKGKNNISGILQGNEYIESNIGEPEIIIYIKFTGLVNITKILIDSKPQSIENTPSLLKIFANSSNTDFSDAASKTGNKKTRFKSPV